MTIFSTRHAVFGCVYCLVLILLYARVCVAARSDKEIRERFYGNVVNSSSTGTEEGSIAKMFDRVLDKEFSENDQPEGSDASSFNNSVADQQAVLETVAKITHEKTKRNDRNDTQEANGTRFKMFFSVENEDSDETTTLLDKKVGVLLAQIGEFAFVLLSRVSNLHLVEVTTPLLFKLIPNVMNLHGCSFAMVSLREQLRE